MTSGREERTGTKSENKVQGKITEMDSLLSTDPGIKSARHLTLYSAA